MPIHRIDTPALILDRAKVAANCARLRTRLTEHGVALRPHVKTAKSVEVTRIALGTDTGPITVSTLKEAEHFFSQGFTDILYGVGIAPGKLVRAAALKRAGCDLKLVLDSVEAATALREFCERDGVFLPALIEIDTDGHRAARRRPVACDRRGAGSRRIAGWCDDACRQLVRFKEHCRHPRVGASGA